ncbi:alpha/beta hydrolase family protein [Herbihabitans rhizosphaerae]|uniref:Alpha/beta hydrolase family protein n=1 Tax=Herbihabitans rhizosphaerae TaxID=1872711 RepID=A0A4Q7L5P5_9PSEU|nr:alpha/beta hydrolase [Herbihabitans rhizosphaerae]RZS44140.1 alpha/beta hydrolase family protein [Herbihabitans rhizosphaerae]
MCVLLAAAGCTGDAPASQPSTSTPSSPAAPAAPPPPPPVGEANPALTPFYRQALVWGPCTSYGHDKAERDTLSKPDVDCAKLRVPLDYAKPEGRVAEIALLRRKATEPARRVGALVVNPGGPGSAGTSMAYGMGGLAGKSPLIARFDVVGFDPRGVGASTPAVKCATDVERDADRLLPAPTLAQEDVERYERRNAELAARCGERAGMDVLANVGTRDVARDLDVLRAALGEPKLTFLGTSYGTHLGSVYAEAYPDKVRAMVLDGAVDPTTDPVDRLGLQLVGFRKAFDAFTQWCAAQRACVFKRSKAAPTDQIQELVNKLRAKPMTVGKRKLSGTDVTLAVIKGLYAKSRWEDLNAGLLRGFAGNGEILLWLTDQYQARREDGSYASLFDVYHAVRCVDRPAIKDKADLARRYAEISRQVGVDFLDDDEPLVPALDRCAFWPAPPTGTPHLPKVAGLPQVLVISSTGDPATPHENGVKLAGALNAVLLTVESPDHGSFLDGNPCVDDAGAAYLIDLRLPPPNTRCR